VKEVKEGGGKIAAFFDLDGTLVAGPSLERTFFRMMRDRGGIPAKDYFLWLREAVRLARRGLRAILYANKMYLRGVAIETAKYEASGISFLAAAVDRVAWHVKQGHKIVLVSGTLEILARKAAKQLEAELGARGLAAKIHVCATRLEEREGKWTGRVMGAAMYGEAKAEAVRRLAEKGMLDLTKSYAYGDSAMDGWMLAAAGRPMAVNPSKELLRIAQRRNWQTVLWEKRLNEESARSTQTTHELHRKRCGESGVAGLETGA
jgi:HAD superfamily hydrolase (TIGR01490 family)